MKRPEDMIFFLKHVENGGQLYKIEEELVSYRWHPDSLSRRIHRNTLDKCKADFFSRFVLTNEKWKNGFGIWGAGR
jgi:hypothetical protein